MSRHDITARATATESGKRRWLPTCSCGWVGPTAKTPEAAQQRGEANHADHQSRPCPTPGKRRFRTREAAEKELNLFWRTAGKGKAMPCRTYECECRRWHMTARPMRSGVA